MHFTLWLGHRSKQKRNTFDTEAMYNINLPNINACAPVCIYEEKYQKKKYVYNKKPSFYHKYDCKLPVEMT